MIAACCCCCAALVLLLLLIVVLLLQLLLPLHVMLVVFVFPCFSYITLTLARTTFPMWRILNPEYTSTWRWALLKTDDAFLMHVLQFAVLLFCPKTKKCYDHGDIKHSRLKRFLEHPQAVSLLHVAPGIRKSRGQRCH